MIHGIDKRWLADAPTITQVREHLLKVCGKSVFIGHSVKHDLNALGIFDVHCIDTYMYEDADVRDGKYRNPKKLKDLASIYLNARIQESVHSSVSTIMMLLVTNIWLLVRLLTLAVQWPCSRIVESTLPLVSSGTTKNLSRKKELIAAFVLTKS